MRIGLIDFDSKLPNYALMKLSAYHKAEGDTVILNPECASQVDKVYVSVLFSWNRSKAERLRDIFPSHEFGGSGWDLTTELLPQVEALKPDYSLYTVADIAPRIRGILTSAKRMAKAEIIVNAGMGYIFRGCRRQCLHCCVPRKEGPLRRVGQVADLINPRSNVVIILDNNLTAAGRDCLEVLKEIRERKLTIDITQGIDIRVMTPEIAEALGRVKHLRANCYAWDRISDESLIERGIKTLARSIKTWRHLCYVLVGFNSSFEEDMHRFRKLVELGVDPFIMVFNRQYETRLNHFARWVNSRIYKVCPDFEDYTPWRQARARYFGEEQVTLFAA